MTPQFFAQQVAAAEKKLNDYLDNIAPKQVGNLAVGHFKENFRKGGFVNDGLHEWKPAKRQGTVRGAAGKYTPLLSGRNHLYGSLLIRPGTRRVTVYTPVIYAAIHNEGGSITTTVTPKMRKFAWRKYYEAKGGKRGKKSKAMETPEAMQWKRLALTKL